MLKNALFASLPIGLVALACVGAAPELTEEQQAVANQYTVTEEPTPQHELDIRFESRVRLVGYDVSAEEVTPGQPFEITWYWRVDRHLPPDFRLFTHIAISDPNGACERDPGSCNRCNADTSRADNGCTVEAPMRGRYDDQGEWIPNFDPSLWVEGTWVRDPQTITIPTEWHSDAVVLYLGLFSGDHRLSITTGPNDGDGRARAATLPIGVHARTRG